MKLSKLLYGTDIIIPQEMEIDGISINSKEVKKNYVFFAIKGNKTDGKLFIDEAIKNGASVIITDDILNLKPSNAFIFRTKDIMKTLSIVSKNFYENPSAKLNIIGITGTKGKTTTSFLIEKALNSLNLNCGLIGTIYYKSSKRIISESENTTPLAPKLNWLLKNMIEEKDKYVVMEVSSHSLKLKRVDDIEFDSAIFTNLQSDHLDFHKTIDDYKNSKLTLFRLLNNSPKKNKVAILNEDDDFSKEIKKILKNEIPIITYSIERKSDFKAKNINLLSDKSIFEIEKNSKIYSFETNLIGKHNIYNVLATVAYLKSNGIDIEKISQTIKEIDSIPGRLEKISSPYGFYVYIDYAHTEESLRQVLITLNTIPHKRIITVFGCGGDRDKTKRAPMGKTACELSDFVIITSDNPRTEDPISIIKEIEEGAKQTFKNNYIKIIDRKQAIKYAINNSTTGDIILIAGKGHEEYQIIGDKKIHFSDRETVIEAIRDIKEG